MYLLMYLLRYLLVYLLMHLLMYLLVLSCRRAGTLASARETKTRDGQHYPETKTRGDT